MPESKGRKPAKKTPAKKRAAKKAAPRKRVVPERTEDLTEIPLRDPRSLTFGRSPVRELEPEEKFELPDLPEPASYAQVLVALAAMDPLEQQVMIAQRVAAMPSQKDGGMPVNIHRAVRGPWAIQLRKLGIFCIPELATHELVPDTGGGILANHTAGRLRKLSTDDFWNMAKQHSPELGKLVDDADTPEKRKDAMQQLARQLPPELRVAFDRLLTHNPEDFTPQ